MRHWLLLLLMLTSAATAAPQSSPTTPPQVELLETYPPGPEIVMPPGQNIWLRVGYQASSPARISIRPYLRGEPAKVGSSGAPERSGGGEMAAFFFFLSPAGGQVDEIRAFAGNGGRDSREIARWPLHVYVYPGAPLLTSKQPAWVDALRAADEARAQVAMKAQAQAAANEPVSLLGSVAFGGFMAALLLSGPLVLLWSAWALWRWRDGWRLLAAIPAGVMGLVCLNIAVGVAIDPTSHNLWPFETLMAGVPCVIFLAILTFLRRRQRRRAARSTQSTVTPP